MGEEGQGANVVDVAVRQDHEVDVSRGEAQKGQRALGSLVAPDVEHQYNLPEGMKYEVGKGLSKLPPADAAPAGPGTSPGLPKAFQGGKL